MSWIAVVGMNVVLEFEVEVAFELGFPVLDLVVLAEECKEKKNNGVGEKGLESESGIEMLGKNQGDVLVVCRPRLERVRSVSSVMYQQKC